MLQTLPKKTHRFLHNANKIAKIVLLCAKYRLKQVGLGAIIGLKSNEKRIT